LGVKIEKKKTGGEQKTKEVIPICKKSATQRKRKDTERRGLVARLSLWGTFKWGELFGISFWGGLVWADAKRGAKKNRGGYLEERKFGRKS